MRVERTSDDRDNTLGMFPQKLADDFVRTPWNWNKSIVLVCARSLRAPASRALRVMATSAGGHRGDGPVEHLQPVADEASLQAFKSSHAAD